MKKLTCKFVVLLLLIAVTLSFSGCNLLFGPSYREASENIEFDDFNQTQMKAYIEAFLEKKYGIDFEVEDVAEILEGPFYISTDDFYTIAESENG
ncbi:MAG: hypothetical protein IKY44_04005, partial [Clostridia bacterium]|nr:hypothetical protein [Clostridia bacterium]